MGKGFMGKVRNFVRGLRGIPIIDTPLRELLSNPYRGSYKKKTVNAIANDFLT
jgi:hypothetical protein